jgi:hypothetical protein
MAVFVAFVFLGSVFAVSASLQSPHTNLAPGSQFSTFCQPCLDHFAPFMAPVDVDPRFSACAGAVAGGKVPVEFRASAFRGPLLRHVRVVSFTGEGYDVFNFLAVPAPGVALPLFGVDIVSLPRASPSPPLCCDASLPSFCVLTISSRSSSGGSLAAIDFQPHVPDRVALFQSPLYAPLHAPHAAWQALLPPGGDLPVDAQVCPPEQSLPPVSPPHAF